MCPHLHDPGAATQGQHAAAGGSVATRGAPAAGAAAAPAEPHRLWCLATGATALTQSDAAVKQQRTPQHRLSRAGAGA